MRRIVLVMLLGFVQLGSARELSLEIPVLGEQRYPEGVVTLPISVEPESISRALIHVPGVSNAQVYTKINTLGAGMIQTLLSRNDELVSRIDLGMHAGKYAFQQGTNTIEVKVKPSGSDQTLYGRWALVQEQIGAGTGLNIQRIVIERTPKTDNIRIEPLHLAVTTASGQSELLTGSTTTAKELDVSGILQGVMDGHAVLKRRSEAASAGSRGISLRTESELSQISTQSFKSSIELLEGVNDFELLIYADGRPAVSYEFSVIRQAVEQTETFPGGKWAVVIGISDYLHDDKGITDLDYAAADAQLFRDFLVSEHGGGFSHNQIRLLLNEQATAQNIRTALFNFLAKSGRDDMVFVYFAGHGSPDPVNPDNHYLLAHDTDPANMGGTAIAMWDMKNLLDFTIRAKRAVVFADACHSGSGLNISGFNSQLNFVNKYLESLAAAEGRAVITASRADEFSYEDPKWGGGHGIFTYSLIEGLKGEADSNLDQVVSLGEVLSYLDRVVPQETDNKQHISYRKIDVNPGLPLSVLSN